MTIDQILDLCGGAARVTKAASAQRGKPFTGVRKWRLLGIDDRWWPMLIELAGGTAYLNAGQLHAANELARSIKRNAA